MTEVLRPVLGGFMSAECFRYLRQYGEETAGRGFIVHAGKARGQSLEDALKGLSANDTDKVVTVLNKVLGAEGTHLCVVDAFEPTKNGYQFTISESACSTGVKSDEPNCAFTMGVFLGVTEVITKQRYNIHETACVATGQAHCVYELEAM